MWREELQRNFRHNFVFNVADGGFFGMGLGFASFVTVIPLFISTLTDSRILIAFVASLHVIGWQLPQLLMSGFVSRQPRYKPVVMFATFHERWPFFGLAGVALLAASVPKELAAVLAVVFVVLHSLSGGFAATAWQTMIGKIMPESYKGRFFGLQSGAANLMGALGALLAGFMLQGIPAPWNFVACFMAAGGAMFISMILLGFTREPAHEVTPPAQRTPTRRRLIDILKRDVNFRWFLVVRMLSVFVWLATAFYTVYAVERFGIDERTVGILPALLMVTQGLASPIAGWLGDHLGHRIMYAAGIVMMTLSALLALGAPDLSWFYLAFILAGASNATYWGTAISLTLEFTHGEDRPLYLGLANSLLAPFGLLAPIIGGAIAESAGYDGAFLLCVVVGVVASAVALFIMRDPIPTPVVLPVAEEQQAWQTR